MFAHDPTCVILADRHLMLAEGIRGLLESAFGRVYVVGDTESLQEGARRLAPAVVVLDLSLAAPHLAGLLSSLHEASPESRMIVLTMHDGATVASEALAAGASGVVLKRCAGEDLLEAVDTVLLDGTFVSKDFGLEESAA